MLRVIVEREISRGMRATSVYVGGKHKVECEVLALGTNSGIHIFRFISREMFNNNSPETPPSKGQPLSSSTPMPATPVNPPPKVSSKTCLPRPLFHDEPETFSTKKEKREGGVFRPPPRPPAKSCPPKSRVFRHRNLLKTQAISFNDTGDKHAVATETPLNCSVYDEKKTESYFEQAFIIEKKIGAGYFGKLRLLHKLSIHFLFPKELSIVSNSKKTPGCTQSK